MATPNIVNVDILQGACIAGAVTTSRVAVVDVTDDYTFKINTVIIANIDGVNSADITIEVSVDNGTTYFALAKTVPVPADSSISVLDTPLYLDETDHLAVTASDNSDLTYVISYEMIRDTP